MDEWLAAWAEQGWVPEYATPKGPPHTPYLEPLPTGTVRA